MKNYLVKAIINFNDIEEKNEYGLDTPRTAEQSIWNCTKERYEYLKQNNAVVLMGIEEVKPEIIPIPNAKPEEVEIIPIPNAKVKDVKIMPVKSTKKKTSKK